MKVVLCLVSWMLAAGVGVAADVQTREASTTAAANLESLFPMGVVPFLVVHTGSVGATDAASERLRDQFRQMFVRGSRQFSKHTCLKFVECATVEECLALSGRACPVSTPRYMRVVRDEGHARTDEEDDAACAVDFAGNVTTLTYQPRCAEAKLLHFLGLAVGLQHEHRRRDRDQFVKVMWENVAVGKSDRFRRLMDEPMRDVGPYDYSSVMHYDKAYCAKRGADGAPLETLVAPIHIGEAVRPSDDDIDALHFLYNNCTKRYSKGPTCRASVREHQVVPHSVPWVVSFVGKHSADLEVVVDAGRLRNTTAVAPQRGCSGSGSSALARRCWADGSVSFTAQPEEVGRTVQISARFSSQATGQSVQCWVLVNVVASADSCYGGSGNLKDVCNLVRVGGCAASREPRNGKLPCRCFCRNACEYVDLPNPNRGVDPVVIFANGDGEGDIAFAEDDDDGLSSTAAQVGLTLLGVVVVGMVAFLCLRVRAQRQHACRAKAALKNSDIELGAHAKACPPSTSSPTDHMSLRMLDGSNGTNGIGSSFGNTNSNTNSNGNTAGSHSNSTGPGSGTGTGTSTTVGTGSSGGITATDSLSVASCVGLPHYEQLSVDEMKSWVQCGRVLGKGSYGVVYLGQVKDSAHVAVKVVSLPPGYTPQRSDRMEQEFRLLQRLAHSNIVSYHGHLWQDQRTLEIFMEYAPKGSVKKLVRSRDPRRLGEDEAANIVEQVLNGLSYLHGLRPPIAHRDVKCDNLLLSASGEVKLADFGCSKLFAEVEQAAGGVSGAQTVAGTPFWMAPEVFCSTPGKQYGTKCDVWSLGCSLVEMLGSTPWKLSKDDSSAQVIQRMSTSLGGPPIPGGVSVAARGFLAKCFVREPADRATAEEMLSDTFVVRPL